MLIDIILTFFMNTYPLYSFIVLSIRDKSKDSLLGYLYHFRLGLAVSYKDLKNGGENRIGEFSFPHLNQPRGGESRTVRWGTQAFSKSLP